MTKGLTIDNQMMLFQTYKIYNWNISIISLLPRIMSSDGFMDWKY